MGLSKRAWLLALILHLLIGGVLLKLLWSARIYSVPVGKVEIHNVYVLNQATSQPSPAPFLKSHAQKIEIAKSGVLPVSETVEAMPALTPMTRITPAKASSESAVSAIEPLAPKEIQQLLQLISTRIQQHLNYPRLAETDTEQGQIILQFELTPQGKLQNVQITQSSGMAVLDQAALTAVLASSPINFPPNFHLNQALILRLPVRFSLQYGRM